LLVSVTAAKILPVHTVCELLNTCTVTLIHKWLNNQNAALTKSFCAKYRL